MGATVALRGRVLYLTEDADLLARQLAGEDLAWDAADPGHALRNDVSTDEIAPGWVCLRQDASLGRLVYAGLVARGPSGPVRAVGEGAVAAGGFAASVAGRRRGKGSSREPAPWAEKLAGIRLVAGESVERIYRQNAVNLGLLVTEDFSVVARLAAGEELPLELFLDGEDPITRGVVEHGGLLPFTQVRLEGRAVPPAVTTGPRPMTLAEKVLAARMVADPRSSRAGVPYVAPGDAGFVRADLRFSHEYVTPMAAVLLEEAVPGARVRDPGSCLLFRDHLALLAESATPEARARGDVELAEELARRQEEFARQQGIRLETGAICHQWVLEREALPGQLVVGTDSHTTMAGAVGALAFGIGTTDLAASWLTGDVRVKVPPTVRVVVSGLLPPGVAAKDLALALLAHPYVRGGGAIGKVLEYVGPAVAALPVDERATLANLAAEAGAFSGIVPADALTASYLVERRGLDPAEAARLVAWASSDPGAEVESEIRLDASDLSPLVALPGDPGNAVRIEDLPFEVPVDIAYVGSCTGGKREDMELVAAVLAGGEARGERVAPGVRLFVQLGSEEVAAFCRERGHLELFERAGARLLPPGCGACIGAGPGVSTRPDEVTVSAVNRNFPGRSGPGRVYLASPAVVAASALAGRIRAWRPGGPR